MQYNYSHVQCSTVGSVEEVSPRGTRVLGHGYCITIPISGMESVSRLIVDLTKASTFRTAMRTESRLDTIHNSCKSSSDGVQYTLLRSFHVLSVPLPRTVYG